MVGIVERSILDAVTHRWALCPHQSSMLVRGSFVTGVWIGPHRRCCQDLDFLALYPTDFARAVSEMTDALNIELSDGVAFRANELTYEPIFENTNFPGLRFSVPALNGVSSIHDLQIDVAFNDPLPGAPAALEIETPAGMVALQVASVELMYAWKLHGIVEREGLSWRPKDLADLWLLQTHCEFDDTKLADAVKVAFDSRDAPIWRLTRLANRTMGQSSGSRRRWAKCADELCDSQLPSDLATVVDSIATKLQPILCLDRMNGPFEHIPPPTIHELERLRVVSRAFRSYHFDGHGSVYVCERKDAKTLPPPLHAETNGKFRERLMRREARGITFDSDGNLVARPYAMFDRLEDLTDDLFCDAEVLVKLDGSIVFPTPTRRGWRLRTRRGESDIANAASRFVGKSTAAYEALVEECLAQKTTPMFEWCSRSRWIVFDHPIDRLVLTGARDHATGRLMPYDQLQKLARGHGVEVIERIDPAMSLEEWIEEVRSWTEQEGCVVRLRNGLQYKIKSDRYRWLHQAVEGPQRDQARWYLWLSGGGEQLLSCSAGRELDLTEYVRQLNEAIDKFCQQASNIVAKFQPPSDANRKRLAAHAQSLHKFLARLVFIAYDGQDVQQSLRELMARRCDSVTEFRPMAILLAGPLWEDE